MYGNNKVSRTPIVRWIGEPEEVNEEYVPFELLKKTVKFYQKCIFGPMTISVDDFVLVSNADSAEPDSVEGCDIGRILFLFEVFEPTLLGKIKAGRDPYRAIVQWYSRPSAIAEKYYDNDDIAVDFDREVIEEHRAYDRNISIETIFKKCSVVIGSKKSSVNGLLKGVSKKLGPMFACRFKFIKTGAKTFKLVPLGYMNPDEKAKTPKSSRKSVGGRRKSIAAVEFIDVNQEAFFDKENLVSPIKIVNNSVIKVGRSAKKDDVNANYLKSPALTKLSSAKRNLNVSLDGDCNSSVDSGCLNYSIVTEAASTPVETNDPLKIKLRLSETQTPRRVSTRRQSRLADEIEAATPTSSARTDRKRSVECEPELRTPTKTRNIDTGMSTPLTGTTAARRKSILKTPGSKSAFGTPKRSIQLTNIVEEKIFDKTESVLQSTPSRKRSIAKKDHDFDYECTPTKKKSTPNKNTPSKTETPATPSRKRRSIKMGTMTPTMECREKTSKDSRKSNLQITRERLHVSAIPSSLPCRESEFNNIYQFLEGKIQDQCGGCIYVSGVPGTGKTATVTGVIRELQKEVKRDELLPFDFIEINGMRLTEPRQAYVEIYKKLTGKTLSWEHAHSLLEKRFTTSAPHRKTIVLLVDELDILCNRRQDVVYNLLDWPTKSAARLVVVTIANTMDLPERLLMGKVTSRLGLTRLTFQPYTHKQLQEIVTARICGSDSFKSDAVQLVARKVAAVSGDCRRALDICRRATEIADSNTKSKDNVQVSMIHVTQALNEMIASPKVQAIKSCSKLEKIFLQGVIAEITRTGVEETVFINVFSQVETIARFLGHPVPPTGMCLKVCSRLASQRLIIGEQSRSDIFQKIILNVSKDDIHFALQVSSADSK
ncbi:ORC1 family protein [Megaselia abdita]